MRCTMALRGRRHRRNQPFRRPQRAIVPVFRQSLTLLTLVVLCLTARLPAAENRPEIIVELDKSQIYEGESVLYRVTLNHVENPSPPELTGFDDFEVTPAGERSLDSRQVFIINGRRTETVRYGRAYDYRLTPRKAGQLTIPAPVARVDGQVLRGRELALQVIGPEEQDVVLLEITADRQAVYPTQPFTVTLAVVVKERPEWTVAKARSRVDLPMLSIPWANDEELPDGLEPTIDYQRWLGALRDRRGIGFGVNNFQQSSVFSLFEGRSSLAFRPPPQQIQRLDADGNPADYWRYEFSRTFVPKQVGQYSFGPASVKGTFVAGVNPSGRLSARGIYAMARPISVTVNEVPRQGRPAWYSGVVGKIQVDAELTPKRCKVGDPMTLTIKFQGEGTLENAITPELNRIPEITEAFKLYEATEEINGDSCQFTYALRPLNDGTEAFPAVPVAYFDVDTRRYVTLHTKPIPIEVSRAQRLSDRQIVSTPAAASGGPKEVGVRREGIFLAPDADASAIRDESVRPGRWLMGLGGMAGLYAVVALLVVRVRQLTGDKVLLRRRGATARARKRLRTALAELPTRGICGEAHRVQAALVGLVADVGDVPEAGLTPKDVAKLLASFQLEGELIDRVEVFLETCGAAQYGGSDLSPERFSQEAEELLEALVTALKTQRLFR